MDFAGIGFGALLGFLSSLGTWAVTRFFDDRRAREQSRRALLERIRHPLKMIKSELELRRGFWFNRATADEILNQVKEGVYQLSDPDLVRIFEDSHLELRNAAHSVSVDNQKAVGLVDQLLGRVEKLHG
jgi:hypothetical protein